jgi:anti-sigma factor RsiW
MEACDKITEEELHAWLDGELAAHREASVVAYLEAYPPVACRLAAYRADGEAIHRIFGRRPAFPAAPTSAAASPA